MSRWLSKSAQRVDGSSAPALRRHRTCHASSPHQKPLSQGRNSLVRVTWREVNQQIGLVRTASPHCHPIVTLSSSHCLLIVTPLSPHCHPIVSLLSPDCLLIVTPLSPHCHPIVSSLSAHCLLIIFPLSPHCLFIVTPLSLHCLLIVTRCLFVVVQVPPTITFCGPNEKVEALPPEIAKLLKWRMSPITPNIVKHTIARSGFRATKSKSIPTSFGS